jgi:hypothetical protein
VAKVLPCVIDFRRWDFLFFKLVSITTPQAKQKGLSCGMYGLRLTLIRAGTTFVLAFLRKTCVEQ